MKKQKTLKVWGGRYIGTEFRDPEAGTGRMVIGAYTKKQAMELGELTPHEFKNYFCETGNEYELNLASEIGVWILGDRPARKLLGRWK